jgi:hypothetical protein
MSGIACEVGRRHGAKDLRYNHQSAVGAMVRVEQVYPKLSF